MQPDTTIKKLQLKDQLRSEPSKACAPVEQALAYLALMTPILLFAEYFGITDTFKMNLLVGGAIGAVIGSTFNFFSSMALSQWTVPGQVDPWQRAPLQVLAHLHALAARGFEEADALGRPRQHDEVVDPLHMGTPLPWSEVSDRLVGLADVLTQPTEAPALLVAAIAHGELMTLQPFRWGSGLIARASVRLVLASRGVDPDLLGCPEAGMLSLGRSSYVAALRGYRSGEPAGVAEWIRWNASAVGFGASSDSPHR